MLNTSAIAANSWKFAGNMLIPIAANAIPEVAVIDILPVARKQ